MKERSGIIRRGSTCLGLVLALACAMPGALQETDSSPEPEAPAPLLISPDAIEMPQSLRQLLGDVSEKGSWREKGLGELISHVSAMEDLAPEQINELESPSYAKLLAAQRVYRGQAIRLTFTPRLVTRHEPSESIPAREPFWILRGFFHEEKLMWDQPIIVVTTFDPVEVLGEPSTIRPDGGALYESPKLYRVNVVGVLFKVADEPFGDMRTGEVTDTKRTPVIVAWQTYRKRSASGGGSSQLPIAIAGIVLCILGLFYVGRRYLKQLRFNRSRETPVERYRREKQARQEVDDAQEDEQPPVDGDLIQAAQEYRKEHSVDQQER